MCGKMAAKFTITVTYKLGKYNPCNDKSQYPLSLVYYEEGEKEQFGIQTGTEVCTNVIIAEDLPYVITLKLCNV